MPARASQLAIFCATLFSSVTGAAIAAPLQPAATLVNGTVSDSITTTLLRDRPGALLTSVDRGAMNARAVLPHIFLALKRPQPQQDALDRLTRDQQIRGSADYHRWLVPADLRRFGPAQADIDRVAQWLRSRNLTVNSVSPSGMAIDFGGTVGAVAAAFHTPIHLVERKGEAHVANLSAPAIPAALAPVVTGVTLANFFPKPMMKRVSPKLTVKYGNGSFYAVAPADFATIYNLSPLRTGFNEFRTPILGTGVEIAVVEQTLIKSADWFQFRHDFGLNTYPGSLFQWQPHGCTSPGFTGDEGEAALDAEWSSAVAPGARITEASCASLPPLNFGVETSLQNLVEYGTNATVFSISYGGPELSNGYAFVKSWNNLLEEGAAEGKAIFVSTGDSGSAFDRDTIDANGVDINGLSDSAYNVAVGGTDFYDTALGQNATYWHQTNTAIGGSAISYNPETAWNNSCANSVLWKYLKAASAIAYCNTDAGLSEQNGVGGTGGQSDYFTKPDWQLTSVPGMPNDGVRDQPDVSLFAANGLWGHFYVFCMSDPNAGGSPCKYSTANEVFGNAAGGTSFASPAFAGIAALMQQSLSLYYGQNLLLGNPASAFYRIAQAQFTTPLGFSKCDSTLGNKISPACVFNYVTAGDITQACYKGSANCQTSAASTKGIGILANTVAGHTEIAYPAQPGYSLATGLGTVNVTNLIYNYDAVYP